MSVDNNAPGKAPDAEREHDPVRAANIGLVLDVLRRHEPISRVEISEKLDLSRSTVTEITAKLLQDGLINVADGPGTPTGAFRGRPRIALTLNPRAAYAVGVRIAISQITVSVTDFVCGVVGSSVLHFRSARQPPEVVADIVEDAIRRAVHDCGLNLSDVSAICAGVPGVVDNTAGICFWSPAFSRVPVPFASLLTERLGVPAIIENHTIPLAAAEHLFGSGQDVRNFVVVTLGHGVGMGIFVNGEIYRGAHGFATELSHTKISYDGPMCRCGQRGCLEAYIGFPGLLRQVEGDLAGSKSDDAPLREQKVLELFERARAGDAQLQDVFSAMGTYLGRALANLVSVLDPDRLIISGPSVRGADLWLESMKSALFPNVRAPMEDRLGVVLEERDDAFWARGAAALVLHQLYRSPQLLTASLAKRPSDVR